MDGPSGRQQSSSGSVASYSTCLPSTAPSEASLEALFKRALMVLSVLFGTVAMIVAYCATDSVYAGEWF